MAEEEPSLPMELPIKTPRRSWPQRVKAMFTEPVKLPGWVLAIYAIYELVPDQKSRIDFWLAFAKSAGGDLAVAANVMASPYFSPGLLATGLAWVIFVGESPFGVQRHHWLRYVGWSIVSLCTTAIVITIGYGVLTYYVQQQVSQRDAVLQR
jgi:hypothetical protein